MTRNRALAAATVLLPVLALALSGCGKGGSDAGSPVTTTVTQTVTEPPTTAPTSESTTAPVTPTTGTSTEPTDPPSLDLSQPPTTFDAAMAHIAAAAGSVQAKRFETPNGAVYCALSVKYIPASCEVAPNATISDPSYCGNGPGSTAIGRIEFDKAVATPICNSDTIREPGATSIDYGTIAMGGTIECLSETIGVTCVDTTAGSGFFLGKGTYDLFSPGG